MRLIWRHFSASSHYPILPDHLRAKHVMPIPSNSLWINISQGLSIDICDLHQYAVRTMLVSINGYDTWTSDIGCTSCWHGFQVILSWVPLSNPSWFTNDVILSCSNDHNAYCHSVIKYNDLFFAEYCTLVQMSAFFKVTLLISCILVCSQCHQKLCSPKWLKELLTTAPKGISPKHLLTDAKRFASFSWTYLEWSRLLSIKPLQGGMLSSGSLKHSCTQTCMFSVASNLFHNFLKCIHVQKSRWLHSE